MPRWHRCRRRPAHGQDLPSPGRRGCTPSCPPAPGAPPDLLPCLRNPPSCSRPLAASAAAHPRFIAPLGSPLGLLPVLLSSDIAVCCPVICLHRLPRYPVRTFCCLAVRCLKRACCPSCALAVGGGCGSCFWTCTGLGRSAPATPYS